MKKILFMLSVGFTSITASSGNVYAQNTINPSATNVAKNFRSNIRQMEAMESPAKMGDYMAEAKNLNTRAIKDFHSRFTKVDNAMWFSAPNGFEAYFVQDGYGDRVLYDKKGKWQYSIIFYDENKLSRDLRGAVKSVYYDMAITQVEEIQSSDGVIYLVTLQDKSHIKILKIDNASEINILQDLNK